ncbi:hypothetical protein [Aureimonas frigidaquae]|uniref:Diguanylate cyclase with PAS/PAC and GAF sensors n=1 Tax=Aureimonas frigidaquae TaxID=424757 RepID=A0A0P0Z2X1_9HYPH|nr:hypothetical protein [Aureimonas frigidaquae]BAT28211.1 diguanylate cyclase with PAS/PAC and GAF sensors [Aureimonas frigidaquae]
MTQSDIHRQRAERLFLPVVSSGGASSVTVSTGVAETRAKSAALKELRLARDKALASAGAS